jgi:hypothetical protein
MRGSPRMNWRPAYILDFKLLQQTPPDRQYRANRVDQPLDRRHATGSVRSGQADMRTTIMAALEKGITQNGTGYSGKTWNILGQVYFPKAVTDSTFAFETNSDPGQFVPVHILPRKNSSWSRMACWT